MVGPPPSQVLRAQLRVLPPAGCTCLPDPAYLPTSPAHRQDGDLALASCLGSSLGNPGWVRQDSGGGSGGSCSLRGQQHLRPLLLATARAAGARDRGQALHGVQVVAMGADMQHIGGAQRQPAEDTGGCGH